MRGAAHGNRAWRAVAVLVAGFLTLGGIGTATGMALGAVGSAPAGTHHHHHDHDGPGPGMRFGDR